MSGNEEYDFSQAKRGAIDPTPAGKTRITIRLDDEIIDWFRQRAEHAGGGNYQTAINQALRDYVDRRPHHDGMLDKLPRNLKKIVVAQGVPFGNSA